MTTVVCSDGKILWATNAFVANHSPHQRGSVENVIGLLRQYIKRDSDLKDLNLKNRREY